MSNIIIRKKPSLDIYDGKYESLKNRLSLMVLPIGIHLANDPIEEYEFRIGTIRGLWFIDRKIIFINAIINDNPHNGNFDDFLEALEEMSKDLKMDFAIINFFNYQLKRHLIEKRGFIEFNKLIISSGEITNGVIKYFQNKPKVKNQKEVFKNE